MRTRKILFTFAIAGLAAASAACQSGASTSAARPDPPQAATAVSFDVETYAQGLAHPWSIAFLPDGEGMLVTERPGRLRLIRDGRLDPNPIPGVPEVAATGQGGLLDIALHPDFAQNRLLYFTYSKPGPNGATTAVGRGVYADAMLTGVEDVFVADAWSRAGQHFGSRIVLHDGYLYVTVGDRGSMNRAQDLGDHVGATLRLRDDGSVPPDNPFVGRTDARDEIYTYGNRNAQGMTVHPATGEIWQSEHGPRGGDELNIVRAGGNYGWPDYRWANHYDGRRIADYDPEGDVILPVMDWTPAIAPAGIAFYTGDVFPQWNGDLFVGSLVNRHLQRVRVDGTRVVQVERLLTDRNERIRDVAMGPDGFIYLLVDAPNAPVLRLVPR